MPSSEFNGPDTPVAVSKRKNNALAAKASDKKSSSAPAHPLRLVNARDNRRQSRQSLSSETDDDSAAVEYSTSQPASPGVDFLAKMSSALASVRTLKRDLAERDATLTQVRAEKEKYEEEHGKIYSQMASLRSRLHVFENQLAKKTQEFVTLQSQFDEAQREITKLRATQADDTSKQTIRIKALEAQVVHWKKQAESAPKPSQNENDSPLVVENAELREMVRALRERVTIYEEEAVDRKDLLAKFELLNERLEETRVSMLRLSTEKTLLQQENQKLKTLVKDLDQVEELKSRLSVLESERSNAKNALKKAMSVIDQEELNRKAMADKDSYIKELEDRLTALTTAPSNPVAVDEPRYKPATTNISEVSIDDVKKRIHALLTSTSTDQTF